MDETFAGVALTHPGRVLYPEQGVTKRELARHYLEVGERMLPEVAQRPLTLVRCPRGRGRSCFYQKHLGDLSSGHLHGVRVPERAGVGIYLFVKDVPGLIALVQLGTLELHPWGSRNDALERPDRMIFDLDPGPDVGWGEVVRAAHDLRERLRHLGLESFPRLTGGSGVHVVVPLLRRSPWPRVKAFSRAVADAMASDAPDRFVATAAKAERQGRIFLDYLRNTRGATAVASYSTRARPGAPVATPLRWDELTRRVAPDHYTLAGVRRRLRALGADPWDGYRELRQSITRSAEARLGL